MKVSNIINGNVITDGISDSGYQCSNKCGMMGQIDGKFWCLTLGGRDSWDYCTPTYNGNFSNLTI